jgi:hypothetical protein
MRTIVAGMSLAGALLMASVTRVDANGPGTATCYICLMHVNPPGVGCGPSQFDGTTICVTVCDMGGCDCNTGDPCTEVMRLRGVTPDGRVLVVETPGNSKAMPERAGLTRRTCKSRIAERSYSDGSANRVRITLVSLGV